ncbi:VanZ family protein [Desulfonema magnum]|uniref:VanZ domain-containing protein n=1 Tax=Desulfonema magnum TaxID=45655 RepID=A0A975GQ80_9BACT|nr:VanZ family protein [Desulfonema magnum]QTA89594.1 VanZ domain-containing protein [Desulfonema magnum]
MEKKYKNILFRWALVFIYCFLIYIQSSHSSAISDPGIPHIDKLLHFLAYALLGVLFFRAFSTMRFKDRINLLMILSILSSICYGISDEIHQHYVSSRSADIMDVLADTFGSICGVFFYELLMVKYGNFMNFGKQSGHLVGHLGSGRVN